MRMEAVPGKHFSTVINRSSEGDNSDLYIRKNVNVCEVDFTRKIYLITIQQNRQKTHQAFQSNFSILHKNHLFD